MSLHLRVLPSYANLTISRILTVKINILVKLAVWQSIRSIHIAVQLQMCR